MTLKAGDQLDHKYWLLHALGKGGFGEVWLARDKVLGDHHVAIKFLTAANPEKDKEFLVEMRALAGLNLPGIVTFHHHFRHQKQLALVMEHCAGGNLLQRLRDKRQDDAQSWVNQVAEWVLQLCDTLEYFMDMKLSDIDARTVQSWAEKEGKIRPTRTRLALRILKAFLRWASAETDYKSLADATAASGKKTREMAGTSKPKNDYIQREQLSAWFTNVRQIQNPVIAAYLQCLLLTGARREELAELKWEDVNFQWRGLTLKDKIEDVRPVPLTPYVSHLLATLPRRNEWVFSSPTSKSGRLTEPSIAHRQACAAAGLVLTLHGLRRSFASLCEWLDIPGGISAQIQGHAPQGVREKNYIRRPLDLLRVHHEKIEAWILQQAGVTFEPQAVPGALRVVKD